MLTSLMEITMAVMELLKIHLDSFIHVQLISWCEHSEFVLYINYTLHDFTKHRIIDVSFWITYVWF